MNKGALARALGVSSRTTERCMNGLGMPGVRHLVLLADLVDAGDPGLANAMRDAIDAIARATGRPLPPRPVVELAPGAALPAATLPQPVAWTRVAAGEVHVSPPPKPRDAAVTPLLVAASVAAAADVLGLAPRKVRAALRAALSTAAQAGLSLDDLLEALGDQPAAPTTADDR